VVKTGIRGSFSRKWTWNALITSCAGTELTWAAHWLKCTKWLKKRELAPDTSFSCILPPAASVLAVVTWWSTHRLRTHWVYYSVFVTCLELALHDWHDAMCQYYEYYECNVLLCGWQVLPDKQKVFAFLPLRSYGFRFIVQGLSTVCSCMRLLFASNFHVVDMGWWNGIELVKNLQLFRETQPNMGCLLHKTET